MYTFSLFAAIVALAFTSLIGCSESNKRSQKKGSDTSKLHSVSGEIDSPGNAHDYTEIKIREYRLNDFSDREKSYLSLYGIPNQDPNAFRSFMLRLRATHEKDVEAGQVSMVWEYLLAAISNLPEELRINQWIDACILHGVQISEQLATGKYSLDDIKGIYREKTPPHPALPDDLIAFLDRRIDELAKIKGMPFNAAVSHLKIGFMTDPYMARVFLDALDKDIDPSRKKRIQELIDSNISASPDQPAAERLKIVRDLLMEASKNEARLITSDDYSYEGNPLRTGTDFIYTAPLRELIRVSGNSLFPNKIKRILIIGPGVSMVAVDDLNNPRQMVEPFALLDILLESGKVDLDKLMVDLLDISPEVINHVNMLKSAAEQKEPITIALGLKHIHKETKIFSEHFKELGRNIPGAVITDNPTITSFYQARKKIQIPPVIVSKLRAIKADMTTINFSLNESYDLILCFNTLIYLNEQERALAGIGIQKALDQHGVFIANNGLSRKTNPDKALLDSDYLTLKQKKWYPYHPIHSEQYRPLDKNGSHLWVYRKEAVTDMHE